MMNYEEKKEKIYKKIEDLSQNDVVLAFSGGVDSSLLLKLFSEAMKKTGKKIYAVTIHTKIHPMKDLEISKKVAKEMGAEHIVIGIDELKEAGIEDNPIDRCYLCKKSIFEKLKKLALDLDVKIIVEGTNEDDLHVYRPGIKAIKELGIKSPLADSNFTKEEVRKLAKEYGISVSNRPSTPCMATRFPYGTKLDYEKIRKVEDAEKWFRDNGFYNIRIRVHDNIARIEIDKNEMTLLLERKEEVIKNLKKIGYDYITLDLEGFRSGSMDINIKK
nr:ATP-dependent sacrificial sulfur transferase LarE [Peptacetobacter sp.]